MLFEFFLEFLGISFGEMDKNVLWEKKFRVYFIGRTFYIVDMKYYQNLFDHAVMS